MKKTFSLFAILLLCCAFLNQALAQNKFDIRGTVKSPKGEALVAANLQLVKDSSQVLVKVEVSDAQGTFTFSNIPPGNYRLMASHYDYALYTSGVIQLQSHTNVGELVLPERAVALKEVKIEAQKPFVEQHFDKTVLNVENSISAAGSNVLEVLEKAPGLSVDQNDNISMRGRTGVLVMINGKRVPMSGTELATMLRSLNANEVAKIDLVTNPSAKYEAAGNAGIIDIRLKKDTRLGSNGSITSSLGHGELPKVNQGLQLNHRDKNLNVFGSYNYVHRKDFNRLDIFREFFSLNEARSFQSAYDQQNRIRHQVNSHNARLGVDYNLSPKTIMGVVGSGIFTDINRTVANQALVLNEQRQHAASFLTDAFSETNRNSQSLNFNLKHTIDTPGREISADVDYAAYQSNDLQNFTTNYFNLGGEKTDSELLFGNMDGGLTIKSVKVDYAQPLPGIKANLEAGLKSSLVNADNELLFYQRENGQDVLDVNKSNHFKYKENINAAYLNLNKKWEQVSLQLGLRLENTNAQGEQLAEYAQVNGDSSFDRNYTQLFPSAFVGYTLNKKHDLGLSLSRRIDRPTYNQLNPFVFYIDPSTKSSGNPFLLPQLTYSFEFTHTFLQKYITKLSYSRTTDNIITVLSPEPDSDPTSEENPVVIQQDRNLAQFDYYGLSVSVPITVARWFTSTNNLQAYYGLYQGNLANTNLRNGRPTLNLNSNNSFTLPNGWSAELIGVYQSREIYGFLDVQPIRFLSVGVQKQLWDKKANLKLNLADIFYSNRTRATTALIGYSERFYQRRDTRVATLSFTYRFGKSQVAPSRRRTGGAEEEKRRAG
ncbi:outer membrane beta-barrel protein [Rufibacter sediminis]|uniref:TonB-dependent receptor n=1 Tax=Rufibacter sediminis TaxID=2762756 RepID=A0ABR6VX60_9BACT|nr:TonB-dependent receptor [Rufibacter sediminis]MBC3541771.1 TonB-dependent receptor [Rufibacter sediminis]